MHTVLAALLLSRGRVVSDTALSSLLWGWDPPATAGAQIYTYMSRLRKRLGDDVEIIRRQPGYLFVAHDSRVDLLEFEDLERRGREALKAHAHEEAAELLDRALGLWQGPALSNATGHLRDIELPRLQEARSLTLEARIEADLALGRHERILAELTGLVSQFPLREQLRAQLMTALYRCGRQADAMRVYHDGRAVLAEQLGVDPGAALNATYQAVLTGSLALDTTDPASGAPGGDPVPTMLPADVEDFVGRAGELAVLDAVIEPSDGPGWRPRRCLVTGMAGVGKTALVVHAAHRGARHYPDGQLYADLSDPDGTPRDPCTVLVRLLRALGERRIEVPGVQDDLEELVRLYRERTADKRLLIVLDGAVGDLQLRPLLPNTVKSAVLITCRTRLTQVAGAQTMALAPLDEARSLELLASAAGGSRVTAEPDAADDLVAYCGGLPLALRITGTRLAARPHWPTARLADRLATPAARLAELSYGDLSVSDALRRSLRSLPATGLRTLRGVARLRGGNWTAQEVAGVLGTAELEAEYGLEQLVDAALMDIAGVDAQGRPIYHCHELVLLFARTLEERAVVPAQRALSETPMW
ncbi:BTAD domain-containing putative transcriptional regulator [Streptomyces lavendulae]|uniref:AfsR/SARP family transcriptional regulator n=1 Tax=Streptomyces lavendulae TaxID=1914 RepID=UPI001F2E2D29|nr:AfsR/SARP family transcriptional regulator [Streptomyces lavendulae]